MIELGWALYTNDSSALSVQSSLIALKEDQTLCTRISGLTGISTADLEKAPSEKIVLQRFSQFLKKGQLALAHYARFETSFLENLVPTITDSPLICTYEIARRLYPDLPSRSIRAVSGYLGHHIEEAKRSQHHIEATSFIWQRLVHELNQRGIDSPERLKEWLKVPPEKAKKKRYALPAAVRLALPDLPGVYKMLGHDGRILYVGKATSLKSRVNSYFRGQKTKGSRLNELVTQIASVDVIVTSCPLEAALVESDAIKSENPPYNRAQKTSNREIGFTNFFSNPTSNHVAGNFGPFSSLRFIEQIYLLKDAADNSVFLQTDFDAEPEVIRQGFDLFRTSYAYLKNGKIDWRRTLCRFWIQGIQRARELRKLRLQQQESSHLDEYENSEVETATETDWQPEDIAKYLASTFSGFARRLHRSRWLNAMADAHFRWSDDATGRIHALEVKDGQYSLQTFNNTNEKRFLNGASRNKYVIKDLGTYDRMQVLHGEIRRLLRDGKEVVMYCASGRSLSAEQLKKWAFIGDFDEEN